MNKPKNAQKFVNMLHIYNAIGIVLSKGIQKVGDYTKCLLKQGLN